MKYTREDVIFWADDERLAGAIGKRCFSGDSQFEVLKKANAENPFQPPILKAIIDDGQAPFQLRNGYRCNCIILQNKIKKHRYIAENTSTGVKLEVVDGFQNIITGEFCDIVLYDKCTKSTFKVVNEHLSSFIIEEVEE